MHAPLSLPRQSEPGEKTGTRSPRGSMPRHASSHTGAATRQNGARRAAIRTQPRTTNENHGSRVYLWAPGLGCTIGHFFPAAGIALKPLGDGFIGLIKDPERLFLQPRRHEHLLTMAAIFVAQALNVDLTLTQEITLLAWRADVERGFGRHRRRLHHPRSDFDRGAVGSERASGADPRHRPLHERSAGLDQPDRQRRGDDRGSTLGERTGPREAPARTALSAQRHATRRVAPGGR